MQSDTKLAREVFKLLGIVGVLVLLGYFFRHGGNFARKPPAPTQLVDFKVATERQQTMCGPASPSGRAIPFEMVYSADKRSWIEFAASRFAALCPNIQVKLTAIEDFAAISGMLAEELQPTLWTPTDDLSVRYLQQRAKQARNPALWSFTERTSLVESPLVLLIWQDRLQLLSTVLREQSSDEGQWARSICAGIPREPDLSGIAQEQMVPGSWLDLDAPLLTPSASDRKEILRTFRPSERGELPTMDELGKWGRVKIGHAMPRPARPARSDDRRSFLSPRN